MTGRHTLAQAETEPLRRAATAVENLMKVAPLRSAWADWIPKCLRQEADRKDRADRIEAAAKSLAYAVEAKWPHRAVMPFVDALRRALDGGPASDLFGVTVTDAISEARTLGRDLDGEV